MKKRLLAFLLAVSIAVSMLVMPASAAGNNTAVQFAITLGAMDSEQSGALNAAVTRGAFARMLTSYSTYRESVSSQGAVGTLYTDLPGSSAWAPYVRIAVQQGWMNGYTDGSFRPNNAVTLEEACTADLLLQVVDFSDPHHREQMEVTQETLKELQAGQIPCLYVMNKADLVMEESELPKVSGDRIYLSAKQGIGLAELLELIQKKLFGDYRECTFLIPYTDGAAVSRLQEQALVRSISYEADGVLISVSCKESDAGRYAAYAVSTSDDAETAFEREGA